MFVVVVALALGTLYYFPNFWIITITITANFLFSVYSVPVPVPVPVGLAQTIRYCRSRVVGPGTRVVGRSSV